MVKPAPNYAATATSGTSFEGGTVEHDDRMAGSSRPPLHALFVIYR